MGLNREHDGSSGRLYLLKYLLPEDIRSSRVRLNHSRLGRETSFYLEASLKIGFDLLELHHEAFQASDPCGRLAVEMHVQHIDKTIT